jgi:hypothetical protein
VSARVLLADSTPELRDAILRRLCALGVVRVRSVDFPRLGCGIGCGIVALFVRTSAFPVAIWKSRRIEERWRARMGTW